MNVVQMEDDEQRELIRQVMRKIYLFRIRNDYPAWETVSCARSDSMGPSQKEGL